MDDQCWALALAMTSLTTASDPPALCEDLFSLSADHLERRHNLDTILS